jgi:non-specific serine/threonine protein kinase/serine/threonine-protein kinase
VEETVHREDERCLAGRYRLGALLGTGGMSVVHDGFDERLQRPVAVKCLRPEMAARDDVRSRFETEARWAARLTHPHAVAVYDTGEDDGVPYMVMERLPGETLRGRMAEGPVDDVAWLRRIALEVLGALGAAHECGIVHRDIKPGNILLTTSGHAKVADFGIAKSLGLDGDASGERADLTHTGQLVGTPSYLAPERLDGASATAQSDLWSLGVVLYEALAGHKPFVGDDALSVAYAIKHADPPSLVALRPDVPTDLALAVTRAMERDPARRWSSALEMSTALRPAGGAVAASRPDATIAAPAESTLHGIAPVPTEPDVEPVGGRRRRFAPTWLLVPLGLLLIVLLAAFVSARDGGVSLSPGGGDKPAAGSGQGDAKLAADLRTVADRVEVGDGSRGPEAARRLREIAALVAAGKPAGDEATSLLRDASRWNNDGRQLLDTATAMTVDVLRRVPGVDAAGATTAATTSPASGGGGGDAPKSGKAKGHKKGD